jgi:hypothetical protein
VILSSYDRTNRGKGGEPVLRIRKTDEKVAPTLSVCKGQ